jgi:twitching motility protein PilT
VPQLDAMLRALSDRGARELQLKEGAQPTLRFNEGDKPVSPTALSRAQIIRLVSELSTGSETARLQDGGPARFVYQMADGRAFAIEAGTAGASFAAKLVPTVLPPAPPPPAAVAPAPKPAPAPRPEPLPRPAVPAPAPAPSEASSRFDARKVRQGAPAIEAYLQYLVEAGGSDLHISSGEAPMIRIHGDMERIPGTKECSPEETARLLFQLMPARYKQEFEQTSDTDFAHEIPGLARFRCNVFADRKGPGGVFRTIPSRIPSVEELGLSKQVLELCHLTKGLVLVTGPTGSGKSTTLAGMIDYVNRTRTDHIITIEDPIEFVHPNKKCLVNQREVGVHTEGFKKALRAALREDPDIVLVGEMRDLETIAIAIETAETGHLVFGTLHTSTAPSTIDRVIDQFPADRQPQIRVMLSESLKGVISQTLLKRKGGGRMAAYEVLIGIPAVSNLVREGKTFQIPSVMQTSRKFGMVMLNDSLLDLVKRDLVTVDDAYVKAVDKLAFLALLKSANIPPPTMAASTP